MIVRDLSLFVSLFAMSLTVTRGHGPRMDAPRNLLNLRERRSGSRHRPTGQDEEFGGADGTRTQRHSDAHARSISAPMSFVPVFVPVLDSPGMLYALDIKAMEAERERMKRKFSEPKFTPYSCAEAFARRGKGWSQSSSCALVSCRLSSFCSPRSMFPVGFLLRLAVWRACGWILGE